MIGQSRSEQQPSRISANKSKNEITSLHHTKALKHLKKTLASKVEDLQNKVTIGFDFLEDNVVVVIISYCNHYDTNCWLRSCIEEHPELDDELIIELLSPRTTLKQKT